MHPAIAQHRSGISAICERYRINRLDVFGSAARGDDFKPASSDVDFLIEFAPEVRTGLNEYFGVKAALEQLLGRDVDLVEAGAVRNPYVLASIIRNLEPLYAA
jgi:predicted nucleotidyltransferase